MKMSPRVRTATTNQALPALVSVEGLADHWAVSADTVRLWCRTKKIKSIRIGRKILIDVKSLPSAKT